MTTNGQTVTQPQQLLFDTRQVIRDDTYDWNNRPEDNQTLKIIDDYLYINGVKTYYLNGHNVYIGVLVNTLFSDGGSEPLTLHKSFRTKYVSDSDISSDLGFGIEYGYLPNEGAVMPTKGVTTLYASPLSADANRTRQYHFAESAYYS